MARATREFELGDLAEEFDARVAEHGLGRARRWYWRQSLRAIVFRSPPRDVVVPDDKRSSPFAPGVVMASLLYDLRFAVRLLYRAPAASLAAVLTFALGIGANVAIFGVAWPVLVAPLPFPDEARLTLVNLAIERNGRSVRNTVSPGDYYDLRATTSFESMASYAAFSSQQTLTGHGDPAPVEIGAVSDRFFSVLGVRPIVGRAIEPGDATRDTRVVVIKERLWRSAFGGDASVVGRMIQLDGLSREVIGVLPNSAGLGTRDADAWVPQPEPPNNVRRAYWLGIVARLKGDVALATANAELASIMRRAALEYPESNRNISARAEPLRDRVFGPVRQTYTLLAGAAAVVLLIAGINLAGLQLARTVARERELGIRLALGASRLRLARLLVTESVVVAVVGGAAGLLSASFVLSTLASLAPAIVQNDASLLSRGSVLAYTAVLSLAAGFCVGLIPAWRVSRSGSRLVTHTRGATGHRRTAHARSIVVGVQVALTVVLLIVATLVTGSLARVLAVDQGFDLRRGLIADVTLPAVRYGDTDAVVRFFEALVDRVEALPGVERACATNDVPLDNAAFNMTYVAAGSTALVSAFPKTVTPGCFEVMGIRALRGRLFAPRETERVAIVSESMARRLWPDGRNPVSERIHLGLPTGDLFTVVGVVPDIRNASLESRAEQQVWMPHTADVFRPARLLVSSTIAPAGLAPSVRGVLRDIDPNLALANVRTMNDVVADATATRRFVLMLLGGFAVVALALSAVGIYGVLAHVVGQRTVEIGIRLALGATARQVMQLVGGQMALWVAAGAAAGFIAAWTGSTAFAALLFQMSPTDLRVYVGVAGFVLVCALVAAWVPTRRAARVDPASVLRQV
jgi:putative ABC transport system permease protein